MSLRVSAKGSEGILPPPTPSMPRSRRLARQGQAPHAGGVTRPISRPEADNNRSKNRAVRGASRQPGQSERANTRASNHPESLSAAKVLYVSLADSVCPQTRLVRGKGGSPTLPRPMKPRSSATLLAAAGLTCGPNGRPQCVLDPHPPFPCGLARAFSSPCSSAWLSPFAVSTPWPAGRSSGVPLVCLLSAPNLRQGSTSTELKPA